MSDDYTNLDLDTAEELLIAAGRPELAQALRYQAQGVRNLVQGEWGQSFIRAVDGLLVKHVGPLSAGQDDIKTLVEASVADIKKDIGDMGQTLTAMIGRVDSLEETQHDHTLLLAQHTEMLAQHTTRLDAHDRMLKLFAEWRTRLDEWRKQLT